MAKPAIQRGVNEPTHTGVKAFAGRVAVVGSGMGAAGVSEPDSSASKCAELTLMAAVEQRCLKSGQVIRICGRSLTPSFWEVFIGHSRC